MTEPRLYRIKVGDRVIWNGDDYPAPVRVVTNIFQSDMAPVSGWLVEMDGDGPQGVDVLTRKRTGYVDACNVWLADVDEALEQVHKEIRRGRWGMSGPPPQSTCGRLDGGGDDATT